MCPKSQGSPVVLLAEPTRLPPLIGPAVAVARFAAVLGPGPLTAHPRTVDMTAVTGFADIDLLMTALAVEQTSRLAHHRSQERG